MNFLGFRKHILGALLTVSLVVPSTCFSAWVNATSNLANMASQCGNMDFVSAVPGKDKVIAGIAGVGLYASTDGGASWTKMGTGAGSSPMDHRPTCIVYDPTTPDIFWESGIYGSTFGVYQTTDAGVTLKALGTIHPNDNVSVDFTDPQRKTLLAPGHETQQKLYKSVDGGQNWSEIGANLPSGSAFPHPYVINTTTYLVGCAGYSGTAGMFRTTDGGATFTSVGGTVTANGPLDDPLVLPDGSIVWGLIYNRGLIRSTDQGVTWRQIATYGNIITGQPVHLPDGRFAGLSATTNAVVASPTGTTWTAVTTALSSTYSGVIYEPVRGSFYAWLSDCGNIVQPAAIMRFDLKVSGVERPVAISVKSLHGQTLTTVVTSVRPAMLSKGETYNLQGIAIRDAAQLKAAGVAIVKHAE